MNEIKLILDDLDFEATSEDWENDVPMARQKIWGDANWYVLKQCWENSDGSHEWRNIEFQL